MADAALLKRGMGELQRSLDRFETYNDGFILPDTFLVIRLDAHRYGNWSEIPVSDYPCSARLTRAFHETAMCLMSSSFRVVLAYCHGDEISLFIDPVENNSPLRRSRVNSVVASAASVHFMESAGLAATFQARLSELPSISRVIEYLLWQRRYCYRNAVTITLRNALIENHKSAEEAEKLIHGASEENRLSLLSELGKPITSIPITTRRGALFWWEAGSQTNSEQIRLTSDFELSDDDGEYIDKVSRLVRGKSVALESAPPPPVAAPVRPATLAQKPELPVKRPSRRANVSIYKV